jgi:transposase
MEQVEESKFYIEGPSGKLSIDNNDKLAKKIGMIFEIHCLGKSSKKVAKRYGYTKQRYYQILEKFKEEGSKGITEKKTGPVTNRILTDTVTSQIIRYRFLDPDSSIDVIVQKLRQSGIKVSKRSVERVITKNGLQKKTPFVKSEKSDRNRSTQDKE